MTQKTIHFGGVSCMVQIIDGKPIALMDMDELAGALRNVAHEARQLEAEGSFSHTSTMLTQIADMVDEWRREQLKMVTS
jgi:hypothetical protein